MKIIKANKYQGLLAKMDAGGKTNPVSKGSRSVSKSAEELGEMATEDERGEGKPLSLVLADLIKGGRDVRQSSLKKRKKRVGKRRELYSKDKQLGMRNPLARARYKSLQRRLARSEGREEAGEEGGYQVIKASF